MTPPASSARSWPSLRPDRTKGRARSDARPGRSTPQRGEEVSIREEEGCWTL
nr:hypothetical protein [Acidimicrobiia bacterium]